MPCFLIDFKCLTYFNNFIAYSLCVQIGKWRLNTTELHECSYQCHQGIISTAIEMNKINTQFHNVNVQNNNKNTKKKNKKAKQKKKYCKTDKIGPQKKGPRYQNQLQIITLRQKIRNVRVTRLGHQTHRLKIIIHNNVTMACLNRRQSTRLNGSLK